MLSLRHYSKELQSEKDKKLKEAEKSRMVGFTSSTSEVSV